jgi:pimeloyl-ACP methyl ester carboxylesterase
VTFALPLLALLACAPPSQDAPQRDDRAFVDDSRPLPALGGQEAADSREIGLVAWSDASDDTRVRPVVLIAHGIDGHPRKFESFATDLAAEGFFVVGVVFPSSNDDSAAGVSGIADLPSQPGDLSAALGFLTDAVDAPDDPFFEAYDPDSIGIIGHSLGGITTLAWTRFPSERPADLERIDAVILLAAAYTARLAFDDAVDPTGPPTFLAHGTEDGTVPIADSEAIAADLADERAFLRLTGVGHSEMLEGDGPSGARDRFFAAARGFFGEQLLDEDGAFDAALASPLLADDGIERP